MRNIEFEPTAFVELQDWFLFDKKVAVRILDLIKESARTPFEGTGKPEALRHNLSGCWSRRITHEHRLVYKVTDVSVIVISCKFHYM